MTLLAVVLGAAIGAPLRYLVDRAVTARTSGPAPGHQFPWGLLVVNVSGSVVAGVALALTTGDFRVFLLTGLCGAFTTFSGFGWEADRLWVTTRSVFWWAVVIMPAACLVGFMVAWRASAAFA
jgi:CrcB protein